MALHHHGSQLAFDERIAEAFAKVLNVENTESNENVNGVLVIGIDFGTTFSGVAWATSDDFKSNQIKLITKWPGCGREEAKAPTELFYEDDEVMWGYEIPMDAAPVQWFKLLLVKDADLTEELRSSEFVIRGRNMLRTTGKTAIDLVADYLGALWTHILDTINKERGKSVVDALTFHVVITVPAIWKGYARDAMQRAVDMAGILNSRLAGPTTLSFVPEPEAAALSVLSEPGRTIKKGGVYVICDAGGGTVDLISYMIDDPKKPIVMHEAVEGTGGLCGGIFIDQALEDICRNRLGRKWDRLSKAGIKQIMKNEWESGAKPQFKPSSTKEYIISIPAEAFGRESLNDTSREPIIRNGRIHLKSVHIQKAFERSFLDIQKLIDGQINAVRRQSLVPTGIILVGGLGGSPYLFDVLEKKYRTSSLSILQPTGREPRTAICMGAVYKAFMEGAGNNMNNQLSTVQVTSTISRLSLGVSIWKPFIPYQHLEIDRTYDDRECIWKAQNQMDWFLKKGEKVVKQLPVRRSYFRDYRIAEITNKSSLDMLQCETMDPPTRKTADVSELAMISFRIDPSSSFSEYLNARGERIKRLDYEVEMIPSGASINFKVYVKGKEQGSQDVKVNFQ